MSKNTRSFWDDVGDFLKAIGSFIKWIYKYIALIVGIMLFIDALIYFALITSTIPDNIRIATAAFFASINLFFFIFYAIAFFRQELS